MATLASENTFERQGFKLRWHYILAIVLILPVLAHLIYSAVNSPLTNYYITVDELLAHNTPRQTVRIGGTVTPGSIDWDYTSGTLTFELVGDEKRLLVTYHGLAPDALRNDATAIVEGRLGSNGSFIASEVLVKCPHRYAPL